MTYEPLDRTKLNELVADLPESVDALADYTKKSDNDLWALVGGMLTESNHGTVEKWRADALKYFAHLDAIRVRYFFGTFTLMSDRWLAEWNDDPRLEDFHKIDIRGDELCFSAGQSDPMFESFCASPITSQIVSLNWAGTGLSRECGAIFSQSDFSNLRSLHFYWEGLRPSGIRSMLTNPTTEKLQNVELDFCGSEYDSEQWSEDHLAGLKTPAQLKTLMISACGMPAETLGGLLKNAELIAGLERLEFGCETVHETFNKFGLDGAKLIANCESLSSLEYLSIRGCEMDDSCIDALIASPYLPTTLTLDAGSEFSEEALTAAAGHFKSVTSDDHDQESVIRRMAEKIYAEHAKKVSDS